MAKKQRPSWVIRKLREAFADKPTKDTKMSRVKRKHPDYLYTAHQDEAKRKSWMQRVRGGKY